jgi:uncharacterized membrane protein YgaE (UPF0421/DUF939 family)
VDLQQHLILSLKAALAAGLAWLAVQPLWGIADEYPYYAPLGAVIAITSTVAGSVRESLQGVLAIFVGASLALFVVLTDLPTVAELAIVVALGTAVSGWWRFGSKASWVPISALFVLIIGRGDAMDYAVAYLGLTSLGALIGIGINIAFPPLALTPMADSVTRLRGLLADQLEDIADGLSGDEPPTREEWEHRQRSIRPTTEEMQRVVGHVTDGRRANWRARKWDEHADRRYQQARALQQVAFLIEDLTALVVEQERADKELVALGPSLRPYAADTLCALAEVLRSVEGETADADQLRAADAAVVTLADAIREARNRSSSDLFAAGTIVAGTRRALASLVPEDLRDEIPADW